MVRLMLLEDMNWMQVEDYLTRDDRIVVITAACEQHAYLSLLTDVRVPLEIAKAACDREGVLIAPPLPYGISPYFTAYPGTISLRPETFAVLVREVLTGLVAQGLRRILVSNGHGGNTGVLTPLLIEIASAHPGAKLELFEAWRHPAVVEVAQQAGLGLNHANWSEAFWFTDLGQSPSGEKPVPVFSRTASAAETRAALGDGNYGGPYTAPDEVMRRTFDAAVEAMTGILREL
jgi:creatinine amidohydrolase